MDNTFVKELRQNLTQAEISLWQCLRARRLSGFKFRRQQPLGSFIVDFVCFEKRLIVEVDGGQHSWEKEKDEKRTLWLNSQGFKVVRYWNNDVLENLTGVLGSILKQLGEGDF